jgi:ferredoxin-NADP reductase
MALDFRSTWRPARVIENRPVADGSLWMALEATDGVPAAFEPGHVLGLGLKLGDDSLMRHAYTVSRGTPSSRRFEHLYRVVSGGRMSPASGRTLPIRHGLFSRPFSYADSAGGE